MEKLKELQQIPIMINNSAESMSNMLKMKSNIKDAKDNAFVFSHTFSDIARYAGEIGGAFMSVDEEIGKAIGSAGGLAGGISKIFTGLDKDPLEGKDTSRMTPEQIEAARKQGEKQKGLALMGGIQNAAGALQGLFGGDIGGRRIRHL